MLTSNVMNNIQYNISKFTSKTHIKFKYLSEAHDPFAQDTSDYSQSKYK